MARRLKNISLLVLFLCTLPTTPWAARLELRQTDTQLNDLSIMVGDEVDIELWVDSGNASISGTTIFLSFDENGESPEIDCRAAVQILKDAGYSNPLGIEYEGNTDDHEGVLKSKALLIKHLN